MCRKTGFTYPLITMSISRLFSCFRSENKSEHPYVIWITGWVPGGVTGVTSVRKHTRYQIQNVHHL